MGKPGNTEDGVRRLDYAGTLGEILQQRPGRRLESCLELPGMSKDEMSLWSSREGLEQSQSFALGDVAMSSDE